MVFNEDSIIKLSFPDFDVVEMEFIPTEKKLLIKIEGAWMNDEERKLGPGRIFLHLWEDISIRTYDSELGRWSGVNLSNADCLKDICELQKNDSVLSFLGFGKRDGLWTEWSFTNVKLEAEFEMST